MDCKDWNARINLRNGLRGRWKYLLVCQTNQTHTFHNDPLFHKTRSPKRDIRNTHMQTYIHTHTTHVFLHTFWYISTIYSSTYRLFEYGENACIQHQQFSYITVTTIIYTDYIYSTGWSRLRANRKIHRAFGKGSTKRRSTFFVEQ